MVNGSGNGLDLQTGRVQDTRPRAGFKFCTPALSVSARGPHSQPHLLTRGQGLPLPLGMGAGPAVVGLAAQAAGERVPGVSVVAVGQPRVPGLGDGISAHGGALPTHGLLQDGGIAGPMQREVLVTAGGNESSLHYLPPREGSHGLWDRERTRGANLAPAPGSAHRELRARLLGSGLSELGQELRESCFPQWRMGDP